MDLQGDPLVFGKRTQRQILQPYRNQNGDERTDALAPTHGNVFQQPLPGLSRADSYSVQTKELKENEERRLLNQSREIITNYNNYYQDKSYGAALNREFVNPKSGQKTVDDYKRILKRANKAKITLDVDGAIVYALASAIRTKKMLDSMKLNPATYGQIAVINTTKNAHNLKENIEFLIKIPKSNRKSDFKKRVKNFHTALFKLIVSNTLSDEGYDLILSYASRQGKKGIDVKVDEMKLALVNTEIRTPSAFLNIIGGSNVQTGGMWQQGGFFMTCS